MKIKNLLGGIVDFIKRRIFIGHLREFCMVKKGSVVRVDHPIVQKKIDKSLKLSIQEGSLTSMSSGFGLLIPNLSILIILEKEFK